MAITSSSIWQLMSKSWHNFNRMSKKLAIFKMEIWSMASRLWANREPIPPLIPKRLLAQACWSRENKSLLPNNRTTKIIMKIPTKRWQQSWRLPKHTQKIIIRLGTFLTKMVPCEAYLTLDFNSTRIWSKTRQHPLTGRCLSLLSYRLNCQHLIYEMRRLVST